MLGYRALKLKVDEQSGPAEVARIRREMLAIKERGGFAGSLDEFFEALTWRQLGLHSKRIVLLNTEGYWDPLAGLVDHVISEGFADASLRDYISIAPDVAALETTLRAALS